MLPSKEETTHHIDEKILEDINKAQNRRRESMRRLYERTESERSLGSRGSSESSLSSMLHIFCEGTRSGSSSQQQNTAPKPPPAAMFDNGRNEDACYSYSYNDDDDDNEENDDIRIGFFMKAMGWPSKTDGDSEDCRSSSGMSNINHERKDAEEEESIQRRGYEKQLSVKSSASCEPMLQRVRQDSCYSSTQDRRGSLSSIRETGFGEESTPSKSQKKELILSTLRDFQTEINALPFPVRTDDFGDYEETDSTTLSLADGAMNRSKNLRENLRQAEDAGNKWRVPQLFRRRNSKRLASHTSDRTLMSEDELETGNKIDCDLEERCVSESMTAQQQSAIVVIFDEIAPLAQPKSTLTDPVKCVTPVSSRSGSFNSSLHMDERRLSFAHSQRSSLRSVFMGSFRSLAESLEDFDEDTRNDDIDARMPH